MENRIEYNFGLKQSVVHKMNCVFSCFPQIEKAIIYGSRAKGNYRNGSDIDITLFGDITFQQLNRISSQLDDLLLPYFIDLSIYKDIDNVELIDHINSVGKLFYLNVSCDCGH